MEEGKKDVGFHYFSRSNKAIALEYQLFNLLQRYFSFSQLDHQLVLFPKFLFLRL